MIRVPYYVRKFIIRTATIAVVYLVFDLMVWRQATSSFWPLKGPTVDGGENEVPFVFSSKDFKAETEVKHINYKVTWKKLSFEERQMLESKPAHELSAEEPYLSRKHEMMKKCEQRLNRDQNIELSRMVYDDKHKFVMCVVPKAASTTWRTFAWYLLEKAKTKEELKHIDAYKTILNRGYLPTLASLNNTEVMKRLTTYTTFFAMRHPFDRLVSAHDSKFTTRDPDTTYKTNIGRSIAINQAKKHMHGIPINDKSIFERSNLEKLPEFQRLSDEGKTEVTEYVKIMQTGEIPFRQFATYVANQKVSSMDVHWRPHVSLCNPCAVNYDFVIKFEDLSRDSNRMLEYLQRGEPKERLLGLKLKPSLITSNKTLEQMKTVDSWTKRRLEKCYEDDFAILGYS